MKRVIVFDTETTGLDPANGDRIIEIAGIELLNALPTDRSFRTLINPQRDIPEEASKIHGFTDADVIGEPIFQEVIGDFLEFVGDAKLVAHNAAFDFRFLNAELEKVGYPALDYNTRAIDTLAMARERFPGQPNSLNILCSRFGIDRSERVHHNALLDCKLLAQVYLELIGGRQHGLELSRQESEKHEKKNRFQKIKAGRKERPMALPSQEILEAHREFIGKDPGMIWNQ